MEAVSLTAIADLFLNYLILFAVSALPLLSIGMYVCSKSAPDLVQFEVWIYIIPVDIIALLFVSDFSLFKSNNSSINFEIFINKAYTVPSISKKWNSFMENLEVML